MPEHVVRLWPSQKSRSPARSGSRKVVALLVSMGKSIAFGSFDPSPCPVRVKRRDEYPCGKICAISVEAKCSPQDGLPDRLQFFRNLSI